MTIHERRLAARAALLAEPHRSDRALAAAAGCTRGMVASIRAELIAAGAIQPGNVMGRDGKVYRDSRRGKPSVDPLKAIQQRAARMLEAMRSPEFAEYWRAAKVSTRRKLAASVFGLNTEAAKLRRLA